MIAPTETWSETSRNEPAARAAQAQQRPDEAPAVAPTDGRSDFEVRRSFWDALMRCLAAVHT